MLCPPLRARAISQSGQIAGGNKIRARRQLFARGRAGAFSVNGTDFREPIRFPVAGWPAYDFRHGADGIGPHLERKIFGDARFQGLHPNHGFTCE